MVNPRQPLLRDYVESVVIAVFLAVFVRSFILTAYKVPTASMAPTLLPGDFIFSYRLPFGIQIPLSEQKISFSAPVRGEVVVFSFPEQPKTLYVKRVVGLPGDRVEIRAGKLMLNDQAADYERADSAGQDEAMSLREKINGNSYIITAQDSGAGRDFGPIIVPPGQAFLLGDHRGASDDSRYWGTVPFERIEGKALVVWLSFALKGDSSGDQAGLIPALRTDRLFQWIH